MAPMASVLKEQANRLLRRAAVEDQVVAEAKERQAAANARKRELEARLEKLATAEKDPVKRAHKMAQARRDWRAAELDAEALHLASLKKALVSQDREYRRRHEASFGKSGSRIEDAAEKAAVQVHAIPPQPFTAWLGSEEGRAFAARTRQLKNDIGVSERQVYLKRQRLEDAERLASKPLSQQAVAGLQTLANVMAGVDELVALTGHGVDFRSPRGVLGTLSVFGIEPEESS